MPTGEDISRIRAEERSKGGQGGVAAADTSAARERAVHDLNEEASKLLTNRGRTQDGATGRSVTGDHSSSRARGGAAHELEGGDSDLSDDAMFSSSLSAAEVLVRGGSGMGRRSDEEQRHIALRTRTLLRSLGFPTLGDVPDDGQLHLAVAGGLKHVKKGGALSSAVRALAVNSRECHLCRLRFTPRETMPSHELYLREAQALARQLVAEGGGWCLRSGSLTRGPLRETTM